MPIFSARTSMAISEPMKDWGEPYARKAEPQAWLVKTVVDQLIAHGTAPTPALGITVIFDLERYGGLRVMEVKENSDARKKGLQDGDVIVAVNGIAMTDESILLSAKETLGVGDSLNLSVDREGTRLDFVIELMDSGLFE